MSGPTGTVIITGGTVGLGYQAALAIAKEHPEYHVVLASRTDPNNAIKTINRATGHNNTSFRPLDLSSLAGIRHFVDELASGEVSPIKALLLNAGIQINAGLTYTLDGFEQTFAVNHLGHALLFYLLCPYLGSDCRIILTSSGTHDPAQKTMVPDAKFNNAEHLAHPTPYQAENYDGRQKYATSKLCNVLWTYALHRRLQTPSNGQKWSVAAFDPGLMPGTGLARDAPAFQQFLWIRVLPRLLPLLRFLISSNIHTPEESGAALAALATGESVSGKYFEGAKRIDSSEASYDLDKQENLWQWTVETLARDEAEKALFEKVYPLK